MAGRNIYIFIDESGTFDFGPNDTKYFILAAVATEDPSQGCLPLLALRHDILRRDPATLRITRPHQFAGFHCTEDPQAVRDEVFDLISALQFNAYSVVVQKNKTHPKRQERRAFYGLVFRGLALGILRRIGKADELRDDTLHIFAASFELRGKKDAFIAGLKSVLADENIKYFLHFHPANSHHMLQVSDYIAWAIFRKYERGDDRSYKLISNKLRSEFPLFRYGTTEFYQYACT
jgi:hypothetical protein